MKPSRKNLSDVPAADLYAELQQRKVRLQKLVGRYERLLHQSNKLKQEIEAQGGSISEALAPDVLPLRRVRHSNKMSLAAVMEKVIGEKKLSVEEITNAVVDSGYKSSSSKLRVIVNLTLIKDSRFKRVSRGVYTTK